MESRNAASVTKIKPVTTTGPKDCIPLDDAMSNEEKETTVVATLTKDALPVVLSIGDAPYPSSEMRCIK